MRPDLTRRFLLVRDKDETGITGTGAIAEGVLFTDETIALRWFPLDLDHMSSVALWPSLKDMMQVHGHYGDTRVVWIDD